MNNRRTFIKNTVAASVGITLAPSVMGMSAKSYNNIMGANQRLHVAICGLGRRYGAYLPAIGNKENNIRLAYLCDVMESQRTLAAKHVLKSIDQKPHLINDFREALNDSKVDALFIATPDHWHTPMALLGLQAGKHIYVEKPCSHTMEENEMLVAAQIKYDKKVQMGNQQRSSIHTINLIKQIHEGVIGNPYKAVAFYNNARGRVPHQKIAEVPKGLDWDLFQGPAPRRDYTSETWDYNWHWYGWDYGTAEAGNNATHELDVARWALGVDLPESVNADGGKYHFVDDGWEMYDTMEARFKFKDQKTIIWDGKSRNNYGTYNGDRGVIIYGSEGSAYVDRSKWSIFDRSGKLVAGNDQASNEAGTALGGGGEMSTLHTENIFDAIRNDTALHSPIQDAALSMSMVHYTNIAYRTGLDLTLESDGKIKEKEAMKLWTREYNPQWKPMV